MFNILEVAEEYNFDVIPWDADDPTVQAATLNLNGNYAVFINYGAIGTNAEATVIEAHETGHCITGGLHRLSSPYELIEKNEYKADYAAAKLTVDPEELRAQLKRDENLFRVAQHFGVTAGFLARVIYIYQRKRLL